jgi:hypothetical protein
VIAGCFCCLLIRPRRVRIDADFGRFVAPAAPADRPNSPGTLFKFRGVWTIPPSPVYLGGIGFLCRKSEVAIGLAGADSLSRRDYAVCPIIVSLFSYE